MTRAVGILAGAAMILLFATLMIVVMPTIQLQSSAKVPRGLEPYSESAQRGRDLYVSLGCVYCHSQQPRDPSLGPDGLRGWGRPSVPGDYTYDSPHLLGTMRTGPDLLNIGARQPSSAWHLSHLYNPRAIMPWSIMPSYPFLFAEVDAVEEGGVVVDLPPDYAPESGVIVALPEALDLVQYLLELDRTYEVNEIPRADAGEEVGP
ncbi:cbb3-type cytochrome c oxidase subunit II [Congregibacter litoralis]|uniref:Cbb3-type cytochrome oxidase, cytochrome c subunit n=1 Tax=Congregibacter litoralis KT71 TaxID=314285 RepID=A4ABS7_9GAMM|nr:cbb3-type cytochrome c oxidase subunit II [Congregibacter litoralis]EAQ96590.1 Cbb3-type cytochrome oxidase, cytochrome c subunit [Congregibacter litoralis KT71]